MNGVRIHATISILAGLLFSILIAYGCNKGSSNSCKGSMPFCNAKQLIQTVDETEMELHDRSGSYTTSMEKILPHLHIESLNLKKIFVANDKVVLTTKDHKFEITIKLYQDHVRVKISPPPVGPNGQREPYCLLKEFGSKEIRTCEVLL